MKPADREALAVPNESPTFPSNCRNCRKGPEVENRGSGSDYDPHSPSRHFRMLRDGRSPLPSLCLECWPRPTLGGEPRHGGGMTAGIVARVEPIAWPPLPDRRPSGAGRPPLPV
jgi:hypothetical protein